LLCTGQGRETACSNA